MAVKWAVASGNWNAGATWNDGVVPSSDDDVYANNYTVTINIATLIVGSINTIANNDYGIVQGGSFTCSVPTSISATRTCDLRFCSGYVSLVYSGNTNANCYFIAPLIKSSSNGLFGHTNGNNTGWIVTANVEISNTNEALGYTGAGNNRHILTINGNITSQNGFLFSNFAASVIGGWTITLNGYVYGGHEGSANQGLSHITINGHKHYCMNEYDLFLKGDITINGSVTYESNSGKVGIDINFVNILNPGTFTCKDVTQPQRVNPFIILTDAEMNNTQQYPQESDVKQGVSYVWGQKTGTYLPDFPQEAEVLQGVTYDNGNKTGTLQTIVLGDYPAETDVKVGVVFDYGNKVGTFQPVADYPAEADVSQGVTYAYGQMTGTLSVATDYPQEANVLQGVEYANGAMVGTLEVVQLQADYPSEDDVRFDVPFDFGNKKGKCHVPVPEDVRDGVLVDVNGVGTLIPSSGGDRLRIADFSYYTNAQSDTYIVDLTEQDKPKFAVAEERVLIEMFPDLDLDNIPEKYFDDLFVKYLKYRLIVEYYRTAGINSTFTPSEPTTEIVNYQNVRNEVWLNSANIYLKAWSKKYPESIVKPQRILL